jgi:ABC-type lipoprotein export system ATPase subunit
VTFFDTEEKLSEAVQKFMRAHPFDAAPVSADVPLISNQEVWLNIALIKQYHENMPAKASEKMVLLLLRRFGLERIAYTRDPALNNDERFFVKLLRSAMVQNATILINRPFNMIPQLKNIDPIVQALKTIDDLYSACHIYDYDWLGQKYGALCQ